MGSIPITGSMKYETIEDIPKNHPARYIFDLVVESFGPEQVPDDYEEKVCRMAETVDRRANAERAKQ